MKPKINTTILISIILLIALVASAIAVVMWHKKIWNFAEYVREQRQVMKNEQAAVQFLNSADKDIKKIQEFSKNFDDMYIGKENILIFIEKLEQIARASNSKLHIQNVTPGEVVADKYNYVHVTMQANGSWNSVKKFVELIELLPHYVSIKVLNLSAGGENGQTWTASMTITTLTN